MLFTCTRCGQWMYDDRVSAVNSMVLNFDRMIPAFVNGYYPCGGEFGLWGNVGFNDRGEQFDLINEVVNELVAAAPTDEQLEAFKESLDAASLAVRDGRYDDALAALRSGAKWFTWLLTFMVTSMGSNTVEQYVIAVVLEVLRSATERALALRAEVADRVEAEEAIRRAVDEFKASFRAPRTRRVLRMDRSSATVPERLVSIEAGVQHRFLRRRRVSVEDVKAALRDPLSGWEWGRKEGTSAGDHSALTLGRPNTDGRLLVVWSVVKEGVRHVWAVYPMYRDKLSPGAPSAFSVVRDIAEAYGYDVEYEFPGVSKRARSFFVHVLDGVSAEEARPPEALSSLYVYGPGGQRKPYRTSIPWASRETIVMILTPPPGCPPAILFFLSIDVDSLDADLRSRGIDVIPNLSI